MSLKAGIEASRPTFEPKRGGHTEDLIDLICNAQYVRLSHLTNVNEPYFSTKNYSMVKKRTKRKRNTQQFS